MRTAYEAATGLDAHMILDLLAQQHIYGQIEGEYLQGGAGGIPAAGLVRVLVPEHDYGRARQIVKEWESNQPVPDASEIQAPVFDRVPVFLAGVLVGAWFMYWILTKHN